MALFKSPEFYFEVLRGIAWINDPDKGKILPKDATEEQIKAYNDYIRMIKEAQNEMVIIE